MTEGESPVTLLEAKDFGLDADIPVTDLSVVVPMESQNRDVKLHVFIWHRDSQTEGVSDAQSSDAVFLSGLNTAAHDYIHALPELQKYHKNMAFLGHADGADVKPDKPDDPFILNKESFAPSGYATLRAIETLINNKELQPGLTAYTHSTGAAVLLEAIALDELEATRNHRDRYIKQAILVAPAGIVNIGDTTTVNTALEHSMGQAFLEEARRAKNDRANRATPLSVEFNYQLEQQIARFIRYEADKDTRNARMDLIKNTSEWRSIRFANTLHEFIENTLERFAFLDDTAKRFHLYWPNVLPHYWPKTPSALHNMKLITTDCTGDARNAIHDTPILLVFFGEDQLVQETKLLTAEDTNEIRTTELTLEEIDALSTRENQQRIMRMPRPHEVYRRLIQIKRGIKERELIQIRAKDKFPNNKPNISVLSIAFTHHMSQRRRMNEIGALANTILPSPENRNGQQGHSQT